MPIIGMKMCQSSDFACPGQCFVVSLRWVIFMKNYRNRVVDSILQDKLEGKGAVLIGDPKWCGKTTTAEQIARSVLYMDDPQAIEQNISMVSMNPKRLLQGDIPRLIDEWQIAPKLWDAIRFEVDHRDDMGQFVLTGSAVPPDAADEPF